MLKIDFHVHTYYSKCAVSSPKEVIKFAIKRGLGGIAITDHNTGKGFEKTRSIKTKLLVIPGVEVKSTHGDIIALGVAERFPAVKSPEETIEYIRDLGGVSLIPHPFDYLRSGIGYILDKLKPDLIEVYNSNMLTPLGNFLASKYAAKMSCGATAGSDAHIMGEVGYAYSFVDDGNIADIISSICKNRKPYYGRPTPLHWSFLRKIRARLR